MSNHTHAGNGSTRKDAILARYPNLIAFAEGDLGYGPARRSGKGYMFHCWNHSDSSPSLLIDDNRFHCFSSACNHDGDLFDWVGWRNNLDPSKKDDFKRILDLLDGGSFTPVNTMQYQNRPRVKKGSPLTPAKVLRDHKQFDQSMAYFGRRAVHESVGRKFYLGARVPFRLPYTFSDGREVWLAHNRYAIPNLRGNPRDGNDACQVLCVAYRYDDAEMRKTLYDFAAKSPDLFAAIRMDIAFRAQSAHKLHGTPLPDVDDPDYLIKQMFRDKYHNLVAVSSMLTYNADYLVQNHQRIERNLVFVVEGQIDCLAMLSAGYPTVMLPKNSRINVPWLFDRVAHVCKIADNDEAGTSNARWVQDQLGTRKCRIIYPDNGKDADDECMRGTVHRWLGRYRYEPTLAPMAAV